MMIYIVLQLSRDELQIDIISETNRKRRKLERERRAMERPQPSMLIAIFSLGDILTCYS